MLIFFNSKLGQLKNGVQNSPIFFKSLLKNKRKFIDVDCVNCIKNKQINLANNINNLYNTNSLINKKKINIGGDHSMAIATVADSLNKYGKSLKVIWFDAHPDINTYNSSLSKNLHGMPLGYLTGLCYSPNYNFIKNTLPFQNILYIGIRDIDKFEKKIIDRFNIKYIMPNDFNEDIHRTMNNISNFIGEDPIHLSFDVDCLDPKVVPCTGTKIDNGLKLLQTKKVLDYLHNYNIVNMDITEINLELGTNHDREMTKKNIAFLFNKYL